MVRFGLALLAVLAGSPVGFGLLLNDFIVTSYSLGITLTDAASPAHVSVNIDIICTSPTSNISLDWGLSLDPPSKENFTIVRKADSSTPVEVLVGLVDLDKSRNAATITAIPTSSGTPSFAAGDKVTLSVQSRTVINKEQKGLFSRHYSSGGSKWSVLATSLFPSYGRELFPCVDEPSMAAPIKLTLVNPASWAVATSLLLIASTTNEATKKSTKTFISSSKLPISSLAIFMSDNMRAVEHNNPQRTNITFWIPNYSTTANVESSLDFLADYFFKIENIIDLNYTLTNNLKIILLPDIPAPFAGHGVIFIRDTLYSSYYMPQAEGLFREEIIPVIYQFLRQFTEFSSRPASWADFWLSSAMATYLQYTILNAIETSFDFRTDLEVIVRQTALSLDDGTHSKALEEDAIDGAPPLKVEVSVMDPLKGQKGASLFSMLDLSFPAGSVFSSIRTLLQNNVGATVSSQQFYDQFTATVTSSEGYISSDTKRALDNFQTWFNSSGYPLINVSTDTSHRATLEMSSFCQQPKCRDSIPSLWTAQVPLGSKTEPRYFTPRLDIWVNSSKTTVVYLPIEEGDWLAANMQSGGFYRTQYSDTNWERLAVTNVLPGGRSQQLDDAFALAEAGLLDYNITLHLAMSNIRDRPYRDWYPVYNGLIRLRDVLLGTDLYPTFQNFFSPLLHFINTQVEDGLFSNPYDKEKVSSLFLREFCNYNIGSTRSTAEAYIDLLLQGRPQSTVVSSSSYNTLVCCGAEYSMSLNGQTLWDNVINSSATYYKRHFNAIALGCLPNNRSTGFFRQLKMYLNSTEVENRNPYLVTMLQFMAEKQPLTLLTLIAEDPEFFQNRFGVPVLVSLIFNAGRKLNNTHSNIIRSIALAKVDDAVKDAASASVDTISTRVKWLNTHKSSLMLALQTNGIANTTNSTSGSFIPTSESKFLLLVPCFIVIVTISI